MIRLTDDEILAAVRPLYENEVCAKEGVHDDLHTARALQDALAEKNKGEVIYIVGEGWQCDEMPTEGTEIYTTPQPDRLAELEAEVKRLREILVESLALNQNFVALVDTETLVHLHEYKQVLVLAKTVLATNKENL